MGTEANLPRTGRPEIVVLPDAVADQIAAGEVVERPASVVKELVENSLDAGATHITVEVERGGKTLIRVLDNGWGMREADLRLALRRHATSKLRTLDDLFGIRTMGFRGEALPSIASVSRLIITSRTADDLAATQLAVDGGTVGEASQVGAPVGTSIEIRDLLYNVPARLKFMKGDATESAHITDVITRLALAHPHVHLKLRHGGRTSIEAPPHRDREERARQVLGARLGRRLHRIEGSEGDVTVTALLAAPELAQSTSRGLQLFVGCRGVRDRGLLHAVSMGYGELVPKGRYPVAVVFIDVGAADLDVNVHPQKLEVRFSDPQAVYAAVRHLVRRGVAEAPWLGEPAGPAPLTMSVSTEVSPLRPARASAIATDYAKARTANLFSRGRGARESAAVGQVAFPLGPAAGMTAVPTASARGTDRTEGATAAAESQGEFAPPQPPTGTGPSTAPPPAGRPHGARPSWSETVAAVAGAGRDAVAQGRGRDAGQAAGTSAIEPAHVPSSESFFSHLRYLGQLDRTYLVCEAAGELVLIDQHAAHERVEFQRLRERFDERSVSVQQLLFPMTVDLDGQQAAVAVDHSDTLAGFGFVVEPFGGNTVALKATPAGLRADAETVLRELLDDLADRSGSRAMEERTDQILATIACHSVVRAGDVLGPREAEALLSSMDGVDFRAHCPHGRPVLLRLDIGEIGRRLGRT